MLPIILFAAAAASAAPAADRGGPVLDGDRLTQRVSYRDLDLSRPEGAATLQRRLRQAASQVCPEQPSVALVGTLMQVRRCQRTALATAQPQVLAAIAAAGQRSGTQLAQADTAASVPGSGRP